MNRGLAARLLIDFIMTILLLCSHAYRVTEDVAHEWIGVAMLFCYLTHLIFNRNWYKNLLRGKYTRFRILMTAINIPLTIVMTALFVTGLLHSRSVLSFFELEGGETLRIVHATAAYWILVLIGCHVGLHWNMILSGMGRLFGLTGKNAARTAILRALFALILIYGIWSFHDRDMFAKLFQGFSFDYWDPERPVILFFTETAAIMGIFVFITNLFSRLLK